MNYHLHLVSYYDSYYFLGQIYVRDKLHLLVYFQLHVKKKRRHEGPSQGADAEVKVQKAFPCAVSKCLLTHFDVKSVADPGGCRGGHAPLAL